MTVTLYTFESESGGEDSFTTQNFEEAREYARREHCLLVENTFEWTDSEPIEDHREGHYSQHFAALGEVLSPEHDDVDAPCAECGWTALKDIGDVEEGDGGEVNNV